jgi:hypothetical protein
MVRFLSIAKTYVNYGLMKQLRVYSVKRTQLGDHYGKRRYLHTT